MNKEIAEDKSFQTGRKSGLKCPFSPDMMDKKSSLRQIVCKGCGTMFKTNKNSNYCLECETLFYDEP